MNPTLDADLANSKEAHENLAALYLIWLRSAGDLSDATGFAAYMTTQPGSDLGRRLLDAHLRNADERSAHSAALGHYLISSLTLWGEQPHDLVAAVTGLVRHQQQNSRPDRHPAPKP